MGLGDYCVVQSNGSRVCYSGNDPNGGSGATGGGNTIPVISPYEGMFIQAKGEAPIYLVQNGQIHWVPDQTTLYALGGNPGSQTIVDPSILAQFPVGAPMPSIQIQTSTVSQPAPTATAAPASTSSSTSAAATTSQSNYVSTTPTYSSVLETGAVYDATTGYYTNPDGTIYMPTAATATFDISSPSTWPTWVWLALAAGGTWLLFFKRGR